jgi:hypothetical protein
MATIERVLKAVTIDYAGNSIAVVHADRVAQADGPPLERQHRALFNLADYDALVAVVPDGEKHAQRLGWTKAAADAHVAAEQDAARQKLAVEKASEEAEKQRRAHAAAAAAEAEEERFQRKVNAAVAAALGKGQGQGQAAK